MNDPTSVTDLMQRWRDRALELEPADWSAAYHLRFAIDELQTIINQETDHIVYLSEDGISIKHPLRERLNGDDLAKCDLHQYIAYRALPYEDGTYRVIWDGIDQDSASLHDSGWYWESIERSGQDD